MSVLLDAAPQRSDLRLKAVVNWARKAADLKAGELLRDAAGLLAESLAMDRYGVAQSVAADETLLKLYRVQAHANAGRSTAERSYRRGGPQSLASYMATQSEVVAFSDLAAEPHFRDSFLIEQGLVSALVCPITIDGRVHAVLATLGESARTFTPEEIDFAEAIAQLVTVTAARDMAQAALAEERRLNQAVVEQSPLLVLMLDDQGNVRRMNRAFERLTGYTRQELQGCELGDSLFEPDDLESLLAARSSEELEIVLVAKGGERRPTRWSCGAVNHGSGLMKVLTGVATSERGQTPSDEESSKRKDERLTAAAAASVEAFSLMPAGPHEERRLRPRRCYPYVQFVAYQAGDGLPSPDDFCEVQCRDISGGGFSFYSFERPPQDFLVVALGSRPTLTYLTARVAHYAEVHHEGRPMYLVGCRYIGRASY